MDRLKRDPNNTDARDEFARILANRLDKPQAALDQVDLLLEMGDQPATQRAEWMGLKAAWLLKHFPEDPRGRELLERILQEFPESVQAMAAQRRIDLLNEQAILSKLQTQKPRPKIIIRTDEQEGEPE